MERFARLFAGRTDYHGRYTVEESRQDGKQKGRGQTVHEPLTEDVFSLHLSGKIRLGVIPIREDGTVSWFAGDIDRYDINHSELEAKIHQKEWPIVVCRSKSGGAHLYCFVRGERASAKAAIAAMKHWLSALGYPKAEVFPKQDVVHPDSVGNWINLPYHNAESPDNYAIGIEGEKLSLEQFIQMAVARI